MQCSSRVTINRNRLRELTEAQIRALEKTGEALHTEVVQAQVVPRDTGNLQNESMFVDYSSSNVGKVSLVHSTPYARRLYYHPEYNFRTDENPNARGKWFEDWINGEKSDFAQNAFEEFYRREGDIT